MQTLTEILNEITYWAKLEKNTEEELKKTPLASKGLNKEIITHKYKTSINMNKPFWPQVDKLVKEIKKRKGV